MFSLIRSEHKTLTSVMGVLSMFRTSYELSRCVLNVKPWMMLMSIVNSVESVSTFCQYPVGKFIDYHLLPTPFAKMSFHTTLVDTTVSSQKNFGT